MTHRVTITSKARKDLNEIAAWWAENRDPEQASRWLQGFQESLLSLAMNPERHAAAAEDSEFPFTLRQLLYGLKNRPTHRAIFSIQDNNEVMVYTIRHLSQKNVTPNDLK